jgi:hypothetical protein
VLAVRLLLEVVIAGRRGSMPVLVHLRLPYADSRNSDAVAARCP